MGKRPSLSDKSFLGHLFAPKRNPLPSGLRKVTLKGTKGGRSAGRLAAFNRMSPASQERLKRAGMREAYLKGEVTLADSKRALRPRAIAFEIVKPPKGRDTALDRFVAERLKATVRSAGRNVNERTVDKHIVMLGDNATEDMRTWSYEQFKYAGRKGSEYEVIIDGQVRNPFWYH